MKFENDKRTVMTLDAGGTNLVFTAFAANQQVMDEITIPTVAEKLDKRRQDAVKVNLNKINKLSKANEVVVVPGKVLGDGSMDHKITLAAFSYSESAKNKLLESKIKILTIDDLLENNPTGTNVKIITWGWE